MVVSVDKAWQQHLTAGAKDRDPRVFRDQLGSGRDLGDDTVALQHRAVLNLTPIAAVGGLGEDGAGADDAGGHVCSPRLNLSNPTPAIGSTLTPNAVIDNIAVICYISRPEPPQVMPIVELDAVERVINTQLSEDLT